MSSIGYKLLTADMQSLYGRYGRITYGPKWQEVPGNGAYISTMLLDLLIGRSGSVLAEIEYKEPTQVTSPDGVICARHVRRLRTTAVNDWTWVRLAIYAAHLVVHRTDDPRALKAIEAAERCEKERSWESIKAAMEIIAPMIAVVDAERVVRYAVRAATATSPEEVTWYTRSAINTAIWAGGPQIHEQIMRKVRGLFDEEGQLHECTDDL